MPRWLMAVAILAGLLLGIAGLAITGVLRILRLLAEDDARERIEWYPFDDPD